MFYFNPSTFENLSDLEYFSVFTSLLNLPKSSKKGRREKFVRIKEMASPKVRAYKFIVVLISLQSMIQVFAISEVQRSEEHTIEVHCSRERSRAAYKVIEEYLIPFIERENYQMSHKCKLHPSNDIFREQEEHKIHVDVNEWRCGYCKKSFRAEKFLDQHFDNRHYNLLNVSGSNCLAELCGALHCDHVTNSVVPKTKCNPAAAARNRHLCESLADSCFPVHQGPSASRLHELFLRQFCDAHTCSGNIKPFPRGGRNGHIELMCYANIWPFAWFHNLPSEARENYVDLISTSKAYQHFLLGFININPDAAPYLLSHSIFVPKRNENGHTGTKTHLKTKSKEKTILVGEARGSYGIVHKDKRLPVVELSCDTLPFQVLHQFRESIQFLKICTIRQVIGNYRCAPTFQSLSFHILYY
ncbi:hypothetical protein L6452_08006 [Arctium lappa]|uniref:Uncharacterized protein n=1 Tax=Arctium lappa TaxID=4217 RepID=A0ACB9DGF8_ARCLA|nr:hypothetical protein L6452_08006 [Arctium lappa]